MTMLAVNNLVAGHGLLTAVRDVSLRVHTGEVLGVIGANGAGKTTLFRTLAGVHPATSGTILLDGEDVSALSPSRRVASGIAMVPEGRRLFVDMTVRENLQIAGENGRAGPWTLESVLDALPSLLPLLKVLTGGLSGGQRQAVAIGRALMSNPRVLLLDEVSLGLSPVAIEGLYEQLAGLKARGDTAMVVVEQDLDRAMQFSDRVVCMLEGHIALEGLPQVLGKQAITDAYFGLAQGDIAYA
ncbi:ABC transporter ATP-binding protein [Devosia sp. FKR38]|uniref:ABC transporter ATP-binding protein n=1 Tax=Devosia sp. FKR38 TaxID=2562312 RepID=UPI0010C0B533|nr:ABC transporter ATP-binding protein [Devosia sp. FKR38]